MFSLFLFLSLPPSLSFSPASTSTSSCFPSSFSFFLLSFLVTCSSLLSIPRAASYRMLGTKALWITTWVDSTLLCLHYARHRCLKSRRVPKQRHELIQIANWARSLWAAFQSIGSPHLLWALRFLFLGPRGCPGECSACFGSLDALCQSYPRQKPVRYIGNASQ